MDGMSSRQGMRRNGLTDAEPNVLADSTVSDDNAFDCLHVGLVAKAAAERERGGDRTGIGTGGVVGGMSSVSLSRRERN